MFFLEHDLEGSEAVNNPKNYLKILGKTRVFRIKCEKCFVVICNKKKERKKKRSKE